MAGRCLWSLAAQRQVFEELTAHVLRDPVQSFTWTLGGLRTSAYAGIIGEQRVVIFVAREGPLRGKVMTAIVPDAKQILQWGLS
jgi:hypothetical protein